MNFESRIKAYEQQLSGNDYIIKDGKLPIILTAVHTVEQHLPTGIKASEPYTAAICQYVGDELGAYYMIKAIDNGIDSNTPEEDQFKQNLSEKIRQEGIKLLIDLHGAKRSHGFDIDFGTLHGTTIDAATLEQLKNIFNQNGICKLVSEEPFPGGGITQYINDHNGINIVQIEINKKYRDPQQLHSCEQVCTALIQFGKAYTKTKQK